jgi:hypothetical protein
VLCNRGRISITCAWLWFRLEATFTVKGAPSVAGIVADAGFCFPNELSYVISDQESKFPWSSLQRKGRTTQQLLLYIFAHRGDVVHSQLDLTSR